MAITVSQAFKDRHKAAVDTTQLRVVVNFTGVPAFPGAPVIVGETWVDITDWTEAASARVRQKIELKGSC